MIKSLVRSIVESGVQEMDSPPVRRTIVLSNYIALILVAVNVLFFVIIPQNQNWGGLWETIVGMLVFIVPIVLNHWRYQNLSRLYLCWCPTILITWFMIVGMQEVKSVDVTSYDGLRFYLLATSCIPFLLLGKKNIPLLIFGIIPSFVCIIFCDPILDFFGVGISMKGVLTDGYRLTEIRAFVSYVVISASCFSLMVIIDNADKLNHQLLDELSRTNTMIQEQATHEVYQLNEQLKANLQQLSEREFILNQSQSLAKVGSWEYDLEAKKVFWSNEMYNIYAVDTDFPVDDFNEIYKLFEARSGYLVRETFAGMIKGESNPFDITAQVNTPLGYKKWVRITGHPFQEEGVKKRVLGLTYDITFFKEAEERLKTSEEKFAKAFRNSPDLMVITREDDLTIIDVNEKVLPVLGYTRQEVIGHPSSEFSFFVNQSDREKFFTLYSQFGQAEMECPWYKKGKRIIQVLITSSRVELEGRKYFISVIKDISDRKAAEEKFIKAFELSPDLMLIFRESDLCLVEANDKLEPLSGYKREEVMGKSSQDFNLWANPEDRRKYFEEIQKHGTVSMESILFTKDKRTFFGNISAKRIALSGENHILVVLRDITERKLAEEKLLQSEASLNAAINNTDFFVWSVDRQLKITSCNEPFKAFVARHYGFNIQPGQSFIDAFKGRMNEQQLINWGNWFGKVISGEVLKIQDTRFGRNFQYSLSPIMGKHFISGMTVFVEDITDRKLAEEKIRQSEINLNAIINNSDMSIWSVDTAFNLVALNNNFKAYIQEWYNVTFDVGQNILEVSSGKVPESIIEYWRDLFRRAFAGELVLTEDQLNNDYLQYSVNPIIEGERVIGAAIYSRNITERVLRERELVEANKKIGELKLMALRSVMNPHFIFNALNSIQYFIAKNDRQNAINYLSTFSKLIRGVLTHSVNDKISLADELDLLKYYINLEMVRFENKFDVDVVVDPELDLENIEIPSLIIQPYVENAILHGLHSKKDKGHLKISVSYDGDRVLFEVEDNGIGRAASKILKEQNFPKHKSIGTVLTEERLNLINERDNVSLKIEDLVDSNGDPSGTRIKIWMRF